MKFAPRLDPDGSGTEVWLGSFLSTLLKLLEVPPTPNLLWCFPSQKMPPSSIQSSVPVTSELSLTSITKINQFYFWSSFQINPFITMHTHHPKPAIFICHRESCRSFLTGLLHPSLPSSSLFSTLARAVILKYVSDCRCSVQKGGGRGSNS